MRIYSEYKEILSTIRLVRSDDEKDLPTKIGFGLTALLYLIWLKIKR